MRPWPDLPSVDGYRFCFYSTERNEPLHGRMGARSARPDLVGISEVAEITGVSRQNIRKLLLAHADTAPAPIHVGNPALWHLTDMLAWLAARLGYEVPDELADAANAAERINFEREMRRRSARAQVN